MTKTAQEKVLPSMAIPPRLISHAFRRPLAVSYSPKRHSTQLIPFRTFAMTSTRDASLQADIGKMKLEPDGSFNRAASSFRNWIQKDGVFAAERDRYHLYVSFACRTSSPPFFVLLSFQPLVVAWATRTLITRKLKGLEDIIPVTVVSPHMGDSGWPFASVDPFPGADVDPLYNARHVKDLYFKADPNYGGRFTVPVLWDKKTHTIVNNESSEIIRIFNTAFNDLLPPEKASIDIYPEEHRQAIDEINAWVYDTVNNGVYKSGFAGTQEAYEKAVYPLFESLDRLEKLLTWQGLSSRR
ncbi:glutathione S-transferase [Lanmaoa asiatica]|nr:glutathione S-transferase [Lanmaoa asiatica]